MPVLLLTFKKERLLLAWICISMGVSVFDARVGINLAAARVTGLFLLVFAPFGVYRFATLIRTNPMRLIAIQMGYLALLGIIFGFVIPWPDDGFLRTLAQEPQGRSVIYMIRLLADTGLVLFITRQVLRGNSPLDVVRFFLVGCALAAFGGILEAVTHVQLYQAITGYPITEVAGRVRGFNFEPRGLGLIMAHGLFFALIWNAYRPSVRMRLFALAQAAVLLLAVSASALVAAATMWVALFIFEPRVRRPSVWAGLIGLGLASLLVAVWSQSGIAQSWASNLGGRFSVDQIKTVSATVDIRSVIAFFDIFDYTAAMFLLSAPLAIVFGTGPGLIMLPGSNFIPAVARWSWVGAGGEGVTSLPSMGFLLELSNGGLVGLLIWIALIIACYHAISSMVAQSNDDERTDWAMCRGAFVVAAAAYVVQVSPLSAVLPLFVGLGVGAAGRLRDAAHASYQLQSAGDESPTPAH
jgi:hypothetical protein